ncbi:MAG TPA: hypothetical protein VHS78_08890 [Candidatus Elarobacter sp.]|jgi:hypothetical protein|nr:hypothetical protein [Candidatus Elarobacter sp.]
MVSDQLVELLRRLSQSGKIGELKWAIVPTQEHSVFSAFDAPFSSAVLRIQRQDKVIEAPGYTLYLLRGGKVVDAGTDEDFSEKIPDAYTRLENLYATARATASGVGDIVSDILSELGG